MLASSTVVFASQASRTQPSTLRAGLPGLVPELYGRALRLTRSTAAAEDLVQDTVERAMRFEGSYQMGTNLRAWMHQILFSVFVSRCRRLRREQKAMGVLQSDPCAWTSNDSPRPMAGLSPAVVRALAELPAQFREAVMLVDLEELAYKDAAERLGVPLGTVMSRLHRGRRLLAEALRQAPMVAASASLPLAA
jgi:RNA polymerase sigma-70 factor, ECF subfamily